jgi:hypothetical protein
MVGPTCNLVEMVAPYESSYRPNIAAASPADRDRARHLLAGVNEFCRAHTASELERSWLPGPDGGDALTHYFNPAPGSFGLDPAKPRAALVRQDRIVGVMFTGKPLPYLGSIPRAHMHDMSADMASNREMLHVYCSPDLRDAFTPNRLLGVMADIKRLRDEFRANAGLLGEPRLSQVLARIRSMTPTPLPAVDGADQPASSDADPALWAKREEIRRDLLVVTDHDLRTLRPLLG